MYVWITAWLFGITAIRWISVFPPITYLLIAIIVLVAIGYFSPRAIKPVIFWFLIMLLGFTWVAWQAKRVLVWHLPDLYEGKLVHISGYISSLPQAIDHGTQFEFNLLKLEGKEQSTKLRLAWYQFSGYKLQVGDLWQLQVRLKKSHGLFNPGGFDYEQWLFAKGIRATGSVVNSQYNQRLAFNQYHHFIDRWRQHLQVKIQKILSGQRTAGLITALIMGAQDDINFAQWEIMRATGTNHLMAIAGVHIGFVYGFIYFLAQRIWRRFPYLLLYLPAYQAAALIAFIAALVYSALAGFALPAQRALIMLSVFLSGLFLRRELSSWNAWALALGLVLLWDPLAVLSISFWLSFIAVASILYGIGGRLRPKGFWWKYGRVQWVISLGLVPVTLWLFQQASLVSLLANLVAVPALGFLILPLCLTGALALMISDSLASGLLLAAAKIIELLWQVLAWFAHLGGAVWHSSVSNGYLLLATSIGVILLLVPRGFPGYWFGLFWLCPVIFYQPASPKLGALRFSLLDVGQGLATVIQTANHSLIFDTGPPMGSLDDAGQRVILPYLQAVGISRIDQLIVSHGDSDHSGGARSLLKHLPITKILTSVPERFRQSAQLCIAGQHWQWDGVNFEILYPTLTWLHQGNNSSCVLRIEVANRVILIPGDIEKPAEEYLLKQATLQADILIAPHHGSKTSSTSGFVSQVHPRYVLFPIGYRNRYHFPHKTVIARYQNIQSLLFNTAESGAIIADIDANGVINITQYRQQNRRIWHN